MRTTTMSIRHCIHQLFVLLMMAMVMVPNTSFVVAVVSFGNESYESMPALFGMDWDPPSRKYRARLQLLPNNTKLCDTEGLKNITMPNGTFPVALLVERGECSFEQKAINAMQQYPALSYMVVYDYKVTKNLVAMRETQSGDGINLGMLFVSNNAGMTLRAFLNNQTEDILDEGGPIIQLDGLDPPMYNESSLADLQTWILIAMGGFFTFVTVFGCLLVFVQLGLIPVNGAGQIILTPEAMRRARRLMTAAEVARLKPGGDLHGKLAGNTDEETQKTFETPSSSMEEGREETGAAPSDTTANPGSDPNDNVVNAGVITHSHLDDDEEHSCAVCLDELVTDAPGGDSENSTLCLPCSHEFHLACIVPWLTERQGTCPLCKFDVLQYIMDLDDKYSTGRVNRGWYKQISSRLAPFGWSPVSLEGSDSDSQQPEGSTSGSEHGSVGNNSDDIPSTATAPI